MRQRTLLLLLTLVSVFLPLRAHAFCYGVTDPIAPIFPPGHVCGEVYRWGHNGSYSVSRPAGVSYVKICAAGSSTECSTIETATVTDEYGPRQVFTFANFRHGAGQTYYNFDLYAWGKFASDYWGSSTKPIQRISINENGRQGLVLYKPPRPADPGPVYPNGTVTTSSYTVRWKSGIDIDRAPYPVTYEIWYKYWPNGGTEPSNYTLSRANMPCQDNGGGPNSQNECTTFVAGPQPAGNWKWSVVANLNVSSIVQSVFPNTWFTTKTGYKSFIQQ